MNETEDIRSMLVDAANRIFADHCDQACVEQAKQSGWSPSLWRVLEDAQITRVSVPEERGGAGGSLGDIAALLRIAGRYCAPVPLAETAMLAGWMLAASCAEVPEGPLAVGPMHRDEPLAADRTAGGFTLSGRVTRMPWARMARRLVVLFEADGADWIACVDPARCTIRAGANVAWEPRDDVRFDAVSIPAADAVRAGPGVTRAALHARGALARAVLMIGALDRALDLSIDYARTRVQFGRPIVKFQAIQQEIARFADEVAAAAASAMAAVGALERGVPGIAIGCAKVRAGEAAHAGSAIAHQVHAAIGVTQEYVLHHATLRLQAWRSEYGSEVEWAERVGATLIDAGADQLWPLLTDSVA